jgi:tetratricopeptide (TPR) repeat protein
MSQSLRLPDLESLWDFENVAESEKRFQTRLIELGQNPTHDCSEMIEALTQLARAQSLQGDLLASRQTLKRAEDLLSASEATYRVTAKIRYLLELGRVYVLEKTPSQARPQFAQAWTLASNSGEDFYAIDAAQMLASVEPQKLKKDWTLKALELAQSSPQPRAKQTQGTLYTPLGWIQYDVRNFEEALTYFRKASSFIQAEVQPRKAIVVKWAVAKTLRALNLVEEALDIQKDLLAELDRLHFKDGYVYEELAECLQSLKRAGEAQIYFDMAYRELSQNEWLTDNSPARLKRLKELGKVK